jgi:enoyl-CoA hydratase/carnithine racemase
MAEVICGHSPSGIEFSKKALQANLEVGSYAAAIELENRGQAFMTRGDDMAEALAAAAEKRPPRFGRAR